MGYTTIFQGELKFVNELSASELAYMKQYLGEDCRDHPEWKKTLDNYYVDLEFNDDFSGIRHNDAEKTYNMVEVINFIINEMKKKKPDFMLVGKMLAQGEDIDDRWELIIKDGEAISIDLPHTGTKITCPQCGEEFYLEA